MGDVIDLEQQQRAPGRTRTPKARPSRQRAAKVAAYDAAVEKFTHTDAVVVASSDSSTEVLYAAREAVAQEAAALHWERRQRSPGSREAARIASRRIAALAEVGRLTLLIAKAVPGEPSPARLRQVLGQLRDDVEAAIDGLFDEATAKAVRGAVGRRLPQDPLDWDQASSQG